MLQFSTTGWEMSTGACDYDIFFTTPIQNWIKVKFSKPLVQVHMSTKEYSKVQHLMSTGTRMGIYANVLLKYCKAALKFNFWFNSVIYFYSNTTTSRAIFPELLVFLQFSSHVQTLRLWQCYMYSKEMCNKLLTGKSHSNTGSTSWPYSSTLCIVDEKASNYSLFMETYQR